MLSKKNKKLRVCVVTGSRAEYGLLFWVMKALRNDSFFDLKILVTGMHLSSEFGNTYQQIEKDGFVIDKKVDMLINSDTDVSISKSMAKGQIGFTDAFVGLKPDLILLLGDRFEIFSAATAATVLKIPIAHFHGGETTQGAMDEVFRHCLTKMSHIHFVAAKEYKKRVIQLGENPKNVHVVGALGIENINKLKLLSKTAFEKSIEFKLAKKNILITFHPVTFENNSSKKQFTELLKAIDELKDTNLIFTKPNADADGRIISKMIDDYVKKNNHKAISFISLGQLRYLSAMQFVDVVVGNSSSGIIEAPTFKIPTVNIGDRQKGRLRAESVIDCDANYSSISKAIKLAFSIKFKIKKCKNPNGDGNSSKLVMNILKKTDLKNILKKHFFDYKK